MIFPLETFEEEIPKGVNQEIENEIEENDDEENFLNTTSVVVSGKRRN